MISLFQSTRIPRGGATIKPTDRILKAVISIHAPHEGVRRNVCLTKYHYIISIHAPHEGCDTLYRLLALIQSFQSTHPTRGATLPVPRILGSSLYFNPRTPRGVRQIQGALLFPESISIHAPHEGCDPRSDF